MKKEHEKRGSNHAIAVEIPKSYLLIMATRGNMGGGELPKSMQLWAERTLRERGFEAEYYAESERVIGELKQRIKNVLNEEKT